MHKSLTIFALIIVATASAAVVRDLHQSQATERRSQLLKQDKAVNLINHALNTDYRNDQDLSGLGAYDACVWFEEHASVPLALTEACSIVTTDWIE